MSVSGVYTYEDDGVINPDNISLVPGSLIPVAPGSKGLIPIAAASNFDVAQLILQDMRANIKKALYMEALGRPEGTPMTATEVGAQPHYRNGSKSSRKNKKSLAELAAKPPTGPLR